ncbi:ATP-binding protein [Anaerocolumna aminovalerica]|jgi:two-component system sensor histidine kinase BaeS|uniref:histidine kinase n=1 Tax=Anaerocolumna aminovalerica TaxID=1527 RepID=A0A1I5CNX8_9FIRM|nr:HAMP domain-containing sensor histidine kinase [Anaerocolumna aminovalerica]MDU6264815.1 HAMP domain-containing sensor histidine kinase [Anaerocolumna aminovalerica]SFN88720.1 Signal transduction histidine kinase [Anaerocolumna aminovalerica]
MTIRKQWLIILVLVAVLSVVVNSFVLSSLTDKYFKDYVQDNYEKHFNQIVAYITETLSAENYSKNQMAVQLETHLVDPINRIKVYNGEGLLLADVSSNNSMGKGMMNGHGMHGMMMGNYNPGLEEIDHAEIRYENKVIGQVNITKYSSAENSIDAWLFQSSLIENSLYSIGIVLIFVIIIGILISKNTSKDLIMTADMAQNIDIGNKTIKLRSNVKEIRVIQQSLESLQTRLKIKQKSRKALIDEMIHQTRTPLTIMKTHLEGIEDGVIELTPEEIKICENQIENITNIITNMSSMIDAEKEFDTNKKEKINISHLLRQIVSGLRAQYEKKEIELDLIGNEKINIFTDPYKLSQAIYNILTNAYKYTNPGGRVQINYQLVKDEVLITIEDNGIGISKEDQNKIFEAYYRSDYVLNSDGEGIGLYVAMENMKSINGKLSVSSELNKGSKFTLHLPKEK